MFRDKNEFIGTLLGGICFLPSFLIVMALGGLRYPVISIVILVVTQLLWLTSIRLCTESLENENRQLKEKLKKT